MIIIVPCSETIVRYWPGGKIFESGLSSSARMSIALRPPRKKKKPMPTKYCSPTTLWSVVRRK